MPIPTSPFRLSCVQCGWKQIVVPRSDAIAVAGACPSCGSEAVKRSPATPLESAGATLADTLRARVSR
ncbi:hypothetical protein P9281_01895 [Caballeronia sp. LP003]|uniref:hypothetical protein n=1 Tax=Caballeronia sp. LP003 TaxID=3038551 RepID=UPI00285EBEF8|nr:hypothetical protein [Caballeronia sp. LP003]MDR5785309.1 hypothetical protein [Caballeronia sp. LP003]